MNLKHMMEAGRFYRPIITKLDKFKSFFYEKHGHDEITKWWHGYCHCDYIRNKVVTCIIPLNLIFCVLRTIFYAVKWAGMDADNFYQKQQSLRNKRKNKFYDSRF